MQLPDSFKNTEMDLCEKDIITADYFCVFGTGIVNAFKLMKSVLLFFSLQLAV